MVEYEVSSTNALLTMVISEAVEGSHRYRRGVDADLPEKLGAGGSRLRTLSIMGREHGRDMLERAAGRFGFARFHYKPDVLAHNLSRLISLCEGLSDLYERLGDEPSRQALVDILKLRLLGPRHAALQTTPEDYRAKRATADSDLRIEASTFEVADPYFSPLSLYRVPTSETTAVTLHCHSVDLTNVFLLEQYGYDRGENRVVVNAGDVVIDIGACWGDTALYFSALAGPDGRVYSFEFDPESLQILRVNLGLNPHLSDRIEVTEKALWDRTGDELEFVQAGRMTVVLSQHRGAATHRVSTVTLDDFVESNAIERVDFVKADVEGAELSVLSGAEQTLKRCTPKIAISAYHHDDDLVQIPRYLESLGVGYRFYLKSTAPVEDETVLFATVD